MFLRNAHLFNRHTLCITEPQAISHYHHHYRRIEVVANGASLRAIASSLRSTLPLSRMFRSGDAQPQVDVHPGHSVEAAATRKRHPELGRARRCRLVVVGIPGVLCAPARLNHKGESPPRANCFFLLATHRFTGIRQSKVPAQTRFLVPIRVEERRVSYVSVSRQILLRTIDGRACKWVPGGVGLLRFRFRPSESADEDYGPIRTWG